MLIEAISREIDPPFFRFFMRTPAAEVGDTAANQLWSSGVATLFANSARPELSLFRTGLNVWVFGILKVVDPQLAKFLFDLGDGRTGDLLSVAVFFDQCEGLRNYPDPSFVLSAEFEFYSLANIVVVNDALHDLSSSS